jgi:acetyl esterase/lipase
LSEEILDLPAPTGRRIAYGPEPSHFGELRLPSGPGPHPTVILLHGGYWRARYDLAYLGQAAAALTATGFATWNVEYRRLGEPGGGWPDTFLDVAAAADFLRHLAPGHGLDLGRVITLGHSAGGQLALWLAGRSRVPMDSPIATDNPLGLTGVVALAPVCDLARAWELGLSDGAVAALLGGSPDRYPERHAAASPLALLPLGIPQILLHGEDDEDVPIELSRRYAAAACASHDPVNLNAVPATGHFELVDPRTVQWNEVIRAVHEISSSAAPARE